MSSQIYLMIKRLIDTLVSLALIALLFPLMLGLSLLIRLTSAGPAIYCQRRLTDDMRSFTMFKFRTMNCDAELETGAVWADEDDQRITWIGRFLRKTRFDELPQLLNVVIGDMSLVGPRPERPEFAKSLQKRFRSFNGRMRVRAGITGLAQIAGGYAANETDYRDKLIFDRLYVRHRSTLLDLQILAQTAIVMLTGRGAR